MGTGSPRTLALWVVSGVIGLAIAFALFFVAFPEASIDFKIAPADATTIAREQLRADGVDVDGYTSTVVLRTDNDAKTFLEREIGLERANVLMASSVSVFTFEVRFFRDLQREEYAVLVDPSGRVVGSRHVVEEERSGPRLEAAAARALAETALRRIEPRLDAYRFVDGEQRSAERPARRDWSFTWERTDLGTSDAPYRLTASVQGGSIGEVHQGLKVPERWKRDFERLRSENSLYGILDIAATFVLIAAVLVVLVRLVRRGAVRWRSGGWLGGALTIVFVAMGLNALPLSLADYRTTTSYPGYVASQVFAAIAGSALLAAVIAVCFAAGEPLYRERWPDRLRLAAAWRPRALGTPEVFGALVIGLSLAGATLGAQVLFYVLGRNIGFWAPQDVRYSDAVGTAFPWLFPLGIGVQAASFEEFLFRLFAIPLLLGVTRSRVVAIIAPAIVWGFGHSLYPVEPGYVRGLEVGLIGIATGLVFLRFGILPTLIWHYTFDAGLIGLLLVRSSNPYYVVSGLIVGLALVVPLVASAVLLARRRASPVDASLLNRADPLPPPSGVVVAEETTHVYKPAPAWILRAALVVGATGVLLFAALHPPDSIGSHVHIPITAREATRLADETLRTLAVDPASYLSTATLGGVPIPRSATSRSETSFEPFDPYANEYLAEQIGVSAADRLYAEQVATVLWRVRYMRDSAKEEYTVLLRPDGGLFAVQHRVDEAAPGADLSRDDARRVAERYLAAAQKLDLAQWRLVDTSSEKHPRRTDHTLVWERTDAVGDAHVRAEVTLTGSEVSGFRSFVKIPEEWEKRHKEQTLVETLFGIARVVLASAAVIAALVAFFRGVRGRRLPWRAFALAGALTAVSYAVLGADRAPSLLSRYTTDIPLATYAATQLAGVVITMILFGGAAFVACAAAWLFAAIAFGSERLPTRSLTRPYWRDAAVLGIAGAGALLLLDRLTTIATLLLPVEHRSLAANWPMGFDTIAPALIQVANLPTAAILLPAIVFAAIALVARYARHPLAWALVVLGASVVFVGEASDPAQLARDVAVGAVELGLVVFWLVRVTRWNVAAVAVALSVHGLVRGGLALAAEPNAFYIGNAVALFAVAALVVVIPLWAWRSAASITSASLERSALADASSSSTAT